MKKILVTGATGFIGNHTINELLKKDLHVIATSSNAQKASSFEWFDRVEYLPFDIHALSPDVDYYTFFNRPDILIHLAWEGLPNYKESFHVTENLPAHDAFLKNLIQNGLRNITVTGTCFEYGMQEGMLNEELPSIPANAYAIAKDKLRISIENFIVKLQCSFKWVRLFYLYGQGQRANSLLSQLQSALDRKNEVFNMSPGDQLRDYLEVRQAANYLVRIALQEKVTGIVNCCSGTPITVKQLVTDYLNEQGKHIKLNLGYYPYPDIEPRNFWGYTGKLKTILANGQ